MKRDYFMTFNLISIEFEILYNIDTVLERHTFWCLIYASTFVCVFAYEAPTQTIFSHFKCAPRPSSNILTAHCLTWMTLC